MKFNVVLFLLTYELLFIQQPSLAKTECKDGDIRLAGSLPKLAKEKVEVCAKKKWSALCSSNLKIDDVRVVCKQMGYSNDNVTVFITGHVTQSSCKEIDVHCRSYTPQNVTAVVSSTSVTVSWKPPRKTTVPSFYHIVCSAFVNNSNGTYVYKVETQTQASTFSATLSQLLPSTAYNCCVSTDAQIQNLTACSSIRTGESGGKSVTRSTPKCYGSAVGGGLGSLVAILLLLLIAVVVYLKFSKKTTVTDHQNNSASVRNTYYSKVDSTLHNPTYDAHYMEMPPDHPNSSQYSVLGPDYESTTGTATCVYSHLRH